MGYAARGKLATRGLAAATLTVMLAIAPAAEAVVPFETDADHEVFDPVAHAIQAALLHPDRALQHLEKRDYAAALDHYSGRRFQPIWFRDGVLTDSAQALAGLFSSAGEWGLEPADYPLPPDTISGLPATDAAHAEIAMTLAVLAYGRHAASGRLIPSEVSRSITLQPHSPDPIALLSDVVGSDDPVTVLEGMHPPHPQFAALRAALLAEIAPKDDDDVLPMPSDRVLKFGVADPRVAVLRHRLGILDDAVTANLYDETVRDAVIAFQAGNGLVADGIAGPRTIGVLNGERDAARAEILVANMERWRWMPRDFGSDFVFVNVPHYTVSVTRAGQEIYAGRVVVGKPRHMTPIFSDEMEHVVVNPYWNVPSSIARNEILPSLIRNPGAGYRYEIIHASGRRVDPYAVDWAAYSGGRLPFRFRQPPGRRNALGSIKFLFPNKHSVYLHDTPSRSLFNRTDRAFSHGCIRLHEPMVFADAVFADDAKWNADRIQRMVGGRESWINLKQTIPVHITYFTAWADEAGNVAYRRDIYGHDGRVMAAFAD